MTFTTILNDTNETSKMLKANFLPTRVQLSFEFPSSRLATVPHNETTSTAELQKELDYKTELVQALSLISKPLANCERVIAEALSTPNAAVQPLLDYVRGLGGKRLRPALLLLSSQAFGPVTEEAVRLAAVVELVHTATLVHDDILDQAAYRRHRATLHCKWDTQSAVLVGDWLFTQAYHLANLGESTLPGRWISWAAKSVCEGEIAQTFSAGNSELTQEAYIDMLAGKTGALCAISCGLGAWASGADLGTCERMYDFGMKLGIAFQIHDDWLDLWGDQQSTGKEIGADLKAKKWTVPLLRFRDTASKQELSNLHRLLNDEPLNMKAIRRLLDASDAESYTKRLSNSFVEQANANLDAMMGRPERDALSRLAHAAVTRAR